MTESNKDANFVKKDMHRTATVMLKDGAEEFGMWASEKATVDEWAVNIDALNKEQGTPSETYVQSAPLSDVLDGHLPASRKDEIIARHSKARSL